ncbi:NAD(P)H-dependent oxidoreductase [Lonepinella sp. BR2271]|uniref:NAD(P)H-dependent oxidoreductase n=1 Tax=Lonepinella sp. BR2271 TaxID=3434550 RepID=UPI003F6E20B1
MKQHVIIFAHPNNNSFTKALVDEVVKSSEQFGANTVVRNLYAMNFNPVLSQEEMQGAWQGIIPEEVLYEQKLIQQADLITLVYPVWWMGFPAMLKGYLDRVFTHGFAYQSSEQGSVGLLQGKKIQQFINIGNNVEAYQAKGFAQALDVCLVNGLFNYCGITDIDHQLFGDLYVISDQERKNMLTQVGEKTLQNLTAL